MDIFILSFMYVEHYVRILNNELINFQCEYTELIFKCFEIHIKKLIINKRINIHHRDSA